MNNSFLHKMVMGFSLAAVGVAQGAITYKGVVKIPGWTGKVTLPDVKLPKKLAESTTAFCKALGEELVKVNQKQKTDATNELIVFIPPGCYTFQDKTEPLSLEADTVSFELIRLPERARIATKFQREFNQKGEVVIPLYDDIKKYKFTRFGGTVSDMSEDKLYWFAIPDVGFVRFIEDGSRDELFYSGMSLQDIGDWLAKKLKKNDNATFSDSDHLWLGSEDLWAQKGNRSQRLHDIADWEMYLRYDEDDKIIDDSPPKPLRIETEVFTTQRDPKAEKTKKLFPFEVGDNDHPAKIEASDDACVADLERYLELYKYPDHDGSIILTIYSFFSVDGDVTLKSDELLSKHITTRGVRIGVKLDGEKKSERSANGDSGFDEHKHDPQDQSGLSNAFCNTGYYLAAGALLIATVAYGFKKLRQSRGKELKGAAFDRVVEQLQQASSEEERNAILKKYPVSIQEQLKAAL